MFNWLILWAFISYIHCHQINLNLKSQHYSDINYHQWSQTENKQKLQINETAILIVDMWDKHWCKPESDRNEYLSVLANETITQARKNGLFIIHAPSDCQNFYSGTKARNYVENLPYSKPPTDRFHDNYPLPIDDSDGGCDFNSSPGKVWTHENPLIYIDQNKDAILADDKTESWNLFNHRGIKNIIYMGSAVNMCVLHRSFAVQQAWKWGLKPIIVRDIADSMYNPGMPPYVTHDEGTELVISYIEKFWADTILSYDILNPDIDYCNSDVDCQLNGVCSSGKCKCDKGWTGNTCSLLNQNKSNVIWPSKGDDHNTAAWGGSIIKQDGKYHLYDDVVCEQETCMHTHRAQIVHAVADNIEGPYAFDSVIVRPEMENVHVVRAPDDTLLLYYTDHTYVNLPINNCTGEIKKTIKGQDFGKRLGIALLQSPSENVFEIFPNITTPNKTLSQQTDIGSGNNPSAYFYANGTVLLAYRYSDPDGEQLVFATADNWMGPYNVINSLPLQVNGEDPYLYRDRRGNFHIIIHLFNYNLSTVAHAFSEDGFKWTFTKEPCANTTITFENDDYFQNQTYIFDRRERPELVFDDNGDISHYISAVETHWRDGPGKCLSYTVLTSLK